MLTRRDFVSRLAVAGAALGAICAAPSAAILGSPTPETQKFRGAVVSFHMDRPYIDPTGTAMPYYPPCGARSGALVARLSEEAFRRMQCYA
jgi:hypothetical protein